MKDPRSWSKPHKVITNLFEKNRAGLIFHKLRAKGIAKYSTHVLVSHQACQDNLTVLTNLELDYRGPIEIIMALVSVCPTFCCINGKKTLPVNVRHFQIDSSIDSDALDGIERT